MAARLMNTVDETFTRAQAENIGVSKNFIRQSVRNGALPCVRAGTKYLINWNAFMSYLENPAPAVQPEPSIGGIRRVGG